ncbi:glycosyltransferase family 1 protein [Campylobacter gracilis]|uniref:glycosyltransferase family 4 protein n=1 Tax=Campylobacter gracilis TaxID=824 RepID=UPI0026F31BC6|nr:glycosyltransferase family 1 protein [Campylobacter gracilis]
MLFVNARFLTQHITGVQRYAIEISKQLKFKLRDGVVFLSPKNIVHNEIARNLDVRVIGKNSGHIWEQLDLPVYIKREGGPLLLNLANTAPVFYKNKICVVHDIAYERFPQTFDWKFRLFYKFLIPKILKTSRKIITVSKFSKNEISQLYGIQSDKIDIVYNSANTTFKNIRIENKEKYVLAVSSLHYQKNFHSLIEAFDGLGDENIKLFLVGEINKNFTNLNLLEKIKNNTNIIFIGRVSDEKLTRLYSNAICFVFPSFYEGFGIPPLEAQSCGCPVVCSNAASLPEIYGDSVVYFDPYNVEDMRGKIQIVLNDENLQNELRIKGFENIKRFSWEESAQKIINLVNKL